MRVGCQNTYPFHYGSERIVPKDNYPLLFKQALNAQISKIVYHLHVASDREVFLRYGTGRSVPRIDFLLFEAAKECAHLYTVCKPACDVRKCTFENDSVGRTVPKDDSPLPPIRSAQITIQCVNLLVMPESVPLIKSGNVDSD